jgi:peptide/nickel transport system substrate-binding protein
VDVADQIPPDAHVRLRQNPRIQHLFAPWNWVAPFLNHKSVLFKDKRIRQAYALTIKAEPIMQAAYADRAFYSIDASLMPKHTQWWTEDGCQQWYNQGDPARARRLLQEAGYKGEPVRYLTTQEYHWAYNTSVVQKQQMEAAGFVVDLRVMDWASIVRVRTDPKNWDMLANAHTAWGDPTGYTVLNPQAIGWWENTKRDELLEQLRTRVVFRDRMAMWKQLQALTCEEAALPKIADANVYRIASTRVRDLLSLQEMPYWNAWIQR